MSHLKEWFRKVCAHNDACLRTIYVTVDFLESAYVDPSSKVGVLEVKMKSSNESSLSMRINNFSDGCLMISDLPKTKPSF